MKQLLTVTLLVACCASSAQTLEHYKRDVDSLSRLYKQRVVGYHKSISMSPIARETFVYYYVDSKGETQTVQAWARVIDQHEEPKNGGARAGWAPNETAVYHNNCYIGYIKNGRFTKITERDESAYRSTPVATKQLLADQKALDSYLRSKFGNYYSNTVN